MRGTEPTKKQAIFLQEHRLNSGNWLICKDTSTEMVIKHRVSGKERILNKQERATEKEGTTYGKKRR